MVTTAFPTAELATVGDVTMFKQKVADAPEYKEDVGSDMIHSWI